MVVTMGEVGHGTRGIAALLGGSDLTRQLRATLRQLLLAEQTLQGGLPPPLLLTGEVGSGKKAVARALHQDGPRSHAGLRVLRCAGLTPARFEHACRVAGSGDAAVAPPGVQHEDAADGPDLPPLGHGATLVFDGVSELIPELQTRLLARLAAWAAPSDRGGRKPAVRVIATTQRSLETLAQVGHFRADLAFRLGVIQLAVPPLRARLEDIEALADRFITELAPHHGRHRPALARSAVRRLAQHTWPGNVGELRRVIDAALAGHHAPMLTGAVFRLGETPAPQPLAHLHRGPQPHGSMRGAGIGWTTEPLSTLTSGPKLAPPTRTADAALRDMPLVIETLQPLRATSSPPELAELAALLATTAAASWRRRPTEVERATLLKALELCHWNVSRAAQALNLSRDALRYRLQKHGLRRGGYDRMDQNREPSDHDPKSIPIPIPSRPGACAA